jgi:hypothetical protein
VAQEQKEKQASRVCGVAARARNTAKDRDLTHDGTREKILSHIRASGRGKPVENCRAPKQFGQNSFALTPRRGRCYL